ncbi:hypothetical protein NPIL_148711 [Nephila pilipes]|uniref:Spider venom protein n=1 Tax=Nephila pilipes TaxID=299642 RepID=A0A8X6PXC1_NEPPI|nr:hypothetical protein NPIL_148711 [Nephila pilipes]
MKLLFLLMSAVIYQAYTVYPIEGNKISENISIENGTAVENWYDFFNLTDSKLSYPQDMHGFGKKVVDKIKDKAKGVKDKIKDIKDKVKDKIKDVKDKIKDKIKTVKDKIGDRFDKVNDNLKDKVGGGGGRGGGGGNYRPYDRDGYRPYDRDYRDRYISGGGGSGVSDPAGKVILIVIGILFAVGVVVGIICYLRS